MITLDIQETGTRLYMPSDLSECDTRQYNAIAALLYQLQHREIPYEVFRIRAVYALLNMQVVDNKSQELQDLKMSNVYQVSELIDSFFEAGEEEGTNILKQYYVHNPLAKVRPVVRAYFGPSNDFTNMKFGEYIDALHFFTEFHETQDMEFLYQLMATCYRPKKRWLFIKKHRANYDGDIRVQHNQNHVERRALKFKLLEFGAVYGFFLLFASFQKYLCSAKIYWQGKEIDLSILFNTADNSESDIPGIGMKSMLFTLAESGAFGSIKELRQESLWEILLRMYDLSKRDADFKAKQQSLKTT